MTTKLITRRKVAVRKDRDSAKPKIRAKIEAGKGQEVIDGLSERQKRFVEEYLVDFNGAKAILRAGYVSKYPNRMAHQLLKNPAVKLMIDQMSLQRGSESTLKPEYVINKVVKTIEKAEMNDNHTAVLRGCELLARHLGMFIERQEISGPNGDPIAVKQVQDAADAFTSAIARLVERSGEDSVLRLVN